MNNVTTLPATSTALLDKGVADSSELKLPKLYEAARVAIEECVRVDECKDWADKAAALRAYAVMRDDVALTSYAQRIHLRAVRQIGLILKQIEPQQGGDRGNSATGGRPPVGETRTAAAAAAGLSEHQRKTALRVANVPDSQFSHEAESASPPTVTELARRGIPPRDWSQPQRIKIDVNRVIGVTVADIYASATVQTVPGGILSLDLGAVSESDATDWAQMLTEALPILTRLRDRLAEHAGIVCGGNEAA